MNYRKQLKNINNRNWDKYSKDTNIKYLKNKLKQYGLPIYKYLQNGNLSENQIINNVKRISREIEKKIDVERQNTPLAQKEKLTKLYKERNKLIRNLSDDIQMTLFKQTKDLNKANNQFKYLSGEDIKITTNFTTNVDTDAPLLNKKIGKLKGTDHSALIKQTEKEIEVLKNNPAKYLLPNIEFNQSFKKYLDQYTKSGYLTQSERNELLNRFTQYSYAKQSYFLNQIADFSKERYRTDDTDINEDLTKKYKDFINDMLENLDRTM